MQRSLKSFRYLGCRHPWPLFVNRALAQRVGSGRRSLNTRGLSAVRPARGNPTSGEELPLTGVAVKEPKLSDHNVVYIINIGFP